MSKQVPARNGGTLTRPDKGESMNPAGKPKGTLSAKTIIRKWLEAKDDWVHPITKEKIKLTQYDIIALQQIAKARKGDTRAFDAVLDRVEGKPKQEIDVNQDITWIEEKTYQKPDRPEKKS